MESQKPILEGIEKLRKRIDSLEAHVTWCNTFVEKLLEIVEVPKCHPDQSACVPKQFREYLKKKVALSDDEL